MTVRRANLDQETTETGTKRYCWQIEYGNRSLSGTNTTNLSRIWKVNMSPTVKDDPFFHAVLLKDCLVVTLSF